VVYLSDIDLVLFLYYGIDVGLEDRKFVIQPINKHQFTPSNLGHR